GWAKNTAQLTTLFALSNLWMARHQLLSGAGEVRPCGQITKALPWVSNNQRVKSGLSAVPSRPFPDGEELVRSFLSSSDSVHTCSDVFCILDVIYYLSLHQHLVQEGLRVKAIGCHRRVGCSDHMLGDA